MRQGIRVAVPFTPETEDVDAKLAAIKSMKEAGADDIRDFEEVKPRRSDRERWGNKPIKVFRATAERVVEH